MKNLQNNFQRFYGYQRFIAIIFFLIISSFCYFSYGYINENLKFYFVLFSLSSYVLLLVGTLQSMSFGIFSLSIMLFLGFWAKNILHILNDSAYLEPIGFFVGSIEQWIEVYIVSSISMLTICIAIVITSFFYQCTEKIEKLNLSFKIQLYILMIITLSLFLSIGFNNEFGLLKLGTIAHTVQMSWIIKVLITSLMAFIVPIILLVLLNNNIDVWKNFFVLYIVFLGYAYYVSISINSRATIVVWIIPILAAIYFKKLISMKRIFFLVMLFFFTLFLSVNNVNSNRYGLNNSSKHTSSSSSAIYRLLIDRWIGLEGLMSMVSYEDRGFDYFIKLTLNMRHKGELDIYTKNIALVHTNNKIIEDAQKKDFASLPGLIAYLYLADSLLFVVIGLFFVINIIIFLERFIFQISNNIFLKYSIGFNLSFSFMPLGIDVIRSIRYQIAIFIFIVCLYYILRYVENIRKWR